MEKPTYEEVQELSENLLEYADMEGTEVGEYWGMIAELNKKSYLMSPKFILALKRELMFQLKDIKKNYEVVEYEYEYFGQKNKKKFLKFKE